MQFLRPQGPFGGRGRNFFPPIPILVRRRLVGRPGFAKISDACIGRRSAVL